MPEDTGERHSGYKASYSYLQMSLIYGMVQTRWKKADDADVSVGLS